MTDEAKAQAERLNKAEQFLRSGNLAGLLRQQDYYNKAHYVSGPIPYGQVADLIETQAREIERLNTILSELNDTDVIARTMAENERLREALGEIMERGGAFGGIWCALAAQEVLAGDSHDQ